MKLPRLRAEIRRLEAELTRMRKHAQNLEMTATMPQPLGWDAHHFSVSAKQRAMVLFWRHLTPEQRSEYIRQKWFTAIGNSSGQKYRISHLRVGRESTLDSAMLVFYCLVVIDSPVEDVMLAKKILIEKDEREFLLVAHNQGHISTSRWEELSGLSR